MAKGSRRLLLGFLFVSFLYASVLRCNVSPIRLWKLPILHWPSNLGFRSNIIGGKERAEYFNFLLRKLVRGHAKNELKQNHITYISDQESNLCITSNPIRITTTPSPTIYTTNPNQQNTTQFTLRPYPRKTDALAMQRTTPITILTNPKTPLPPCTTTYTSPAIIFSTGGFAGNFFHDINDVLIPLFLTAGHLRTNVLLIFDYQPWWAIKYRRLLASLSSEIIITSSSTDVHCFPAAVIGLKYHGNLACNSSDVPGGVTIKDFIFFLRSSLELKPKRMHVGQEPVMVILSRRKSRMLVNEADVVELAKKIGFQVELATTEMMSKVDEFAELVNSCSVLMGVHGAGLTNMVFLQPGSVLLQVVPWGLDWASKAYYGRPAQEMGLKYVEYHIAVEESTLYEEYPKNHPVLTDPWSINLKGYNISRPVYTDGQNVKLDLVKFSEVLSHAKQLVVSSS
ncbi:alpha-1,3-arabinosyltransferase XAT3-like isoform X1 [Dioscorea cayenensis subsp. rotundata]|uniref:Alpha-1,3-arabinosyltransferase XAT3-like isoform X1 n=1 Tax=Dioscorea cayennensis subsp. rotundata TaxID=55577 RepID=A0AB40BIX8_DIOCR|nr:alpha-1,3-arabinosyltransferase XAT3-like isoform X1 [Dioscorea cayenensis subsp. rotundata]